ncbi:MAG: DUF4830 domain-containing protein [Ruminococcaceae bacterium]|nr:DUF4830 domain-containing protein [Oscillospiraceae bacterium]
MFVYSVKGNTLKLAGIICLAAVLMLTLLLLVPDNSENITPQDEAQAVAAEGENTETGEAETEKTEDTAAPEENKTKEEKTNYNKIKTNEDRIKFLEQFGWQVENEPEEEVTVKIPRTFDNVLNSYNNIQLHQGLDLTKYSGKEVSRYTYKVTNYPDYSGDVKANIIVYRNRVIGGDICSADVDGFIKDFTFPTSASDDAVAEEAPDTTADTTAQ